MELITIDPYEIKVRKGLPRLREELGDVSELSESIKKYGQIHPILVSRAADSTLELVAGGRRLLACIQAGIKVNVVVKETMTDIELRTLELEENLVRKDLTWQERAKGIAELDKLKKQELGVKGPGRSQEGWSVGDTADKVGMSRPSVVRQITLAKAIDAFPEISEAKTEAEAFKLLKKIEEKLLVEELVKRKKEDIKNTDDFVIKASNQFVITDALQALKKLPSNVFDFANVDTPYGVELTKNKKSTSEKLNRTTTEYVEWGDDFLDNISLVAKEVYRVLKDDRWIVFWYGIQYTETVYKVLTEAGFAVDKIPAVWYSGAGRSQTNKPEVYLGRSYETFYICRKGNPVLIKRGRSNVFHFSKMYENDKIHPTEKPLDLMREIFSVFVLPGYKCLSPFLGSGNDLRAWYTLGCTDCLGFELNESIKDKFILRVDNDIKENKYNKPESEEKNEDNC